jgi:HK97 family phage prohead protease
MPYFISNTNPNCSGWAVEKEDGEVIGCHGTKQDAIDQMVAVSIAEDMEPGGERALPNELTEGDFVRWDSSGGTARGRIEHVMREGTLGVPDTEFSIEATEDDPAALIRIYEEYDNGWRPTEVLVGHKFSTLTKIDPLPEPIEEEDEIEEDEDESEDRVEQREVNLDVPQYIRSAARKGLDYYGKSLAGAGVVARTVREAREMAQGRITEDKVIRANAWAARHLVDLDVPRNTNPDNDEFPGAGAVAFYLWGIDPTDPQPAMNWFEEKSDAIKADREEADRSFAFHRKPEQKSSIVDGMTEQVETRRVTFNEFELRAATKGDGMSFTGYAAVFNSDSEPLPFIERIMPGAFAKSLRSRNNIRMYMNHDSSMLLATTRAKTLRLQEDSKGLLVDADLPDTSVGRDLSVLMQRKDVDSMSFGFTVPSGGDSWSDDGMQRTLKQIRLFEVSVVTGFPAYAATSASVRSFDALAQRTGMDADQLAVAITNLEAGQTLTPDHAALLRETVAKLEPQPEAAPATIGIMAKHLELLKNI